MWFAGLPTAVCGWMLEAVKQAGDNPPAFLGAGYNLARCKMNGDFVRGRRSHFARKRANEKTFDAGGYYPPLQGTRTPSRFLVSIPQSALRLTAPFAQGSLCQVVQFYPIMNNFPYTQKVKNKLQKT